MMSLSKFAFCLCVLADSTAFGIAYAQVIPPTALAKLAEPSDIKGESPDAFYQKLHEERRQNAPRVILIPGILGSQIKQCEADGSQCKIIWGDVKSLHENVDLSIRSDKKYNTDVVDTYFFTDIYGSIISYLRQKAATIDTETSTDPMLTVFHYDWRLSNAVNAANLAQRVCDVRSAAPQSPVFILAHSMGGLVAKMWAAHFATAQCPNGAAPDVQEIAFVATPHLGAPKAIKAIASGYNILFDELDGIGHYFGYFERKFVLDNINDAGMSFSSIYELLPIRSSEYCGHEKPGLGLTADPVDGEDGNPINMFDVDTWKRYDLLRGRVEPAAARQTYYETKLATLLRQAEIRLCDIVDFDPATVVRRVDYVYGRQKGENTYGWFQFHLGKEGTIKGSSNVQGDDTVPVYSAQNYMLLNKPGIEPAIRRQMHELEVESNHLKIISSPTVLSLVDEWYQKGWIKAELDTARQSPRYSSLLSRENAASGQLIPVSLDATTWSDSDEKLIIDLNSKSLAMAGRKPSEVAEIASAAQDPMERANLFAVAASSEVQPKQMLVWTGEMARSAYVASRFEDAKRSAVFAIIAVNQSPTKDDAELKMVDQQARAVAGWSYLREGDLVSFGQIAKEYASESSGRVSKFKEPTVVLTSTGTGLDSENLKIEKLQDVR
jgi:pimeloyl-ACP methyl ester carboxylesterase